MNRRSFLAGILAMGAAPSIVKVDSLMPIRQRRLILPAGFSATELTGGWYRFVWRADESCIQDAFSEKGLNIATAHAGIAREFSRLVSIGALCTGSVDKPVLAHSPALEFGMFAGPDGKHSPDRNQAMFSIYAKRGASW